MRFTPLPFLVVAFPFLSVAQQPGGSPFDRWDRNDDGKLVREELPEPLRRNFDRVDRDGDGFISREEDTAFRKNRPGGNRPPGPGKGGVDPAVEVIGDIDYAGTGNPRQALDLFLPKDRAEDAGPLPVVVFIHGGGWRNGSKDGGLRRIRFLLTGGEYAGASIGYRLTGEAQWPAQVHDCKAAIRWIRANAGKHGIDPERIAVWGTSAGGHLVSMLGVSNGVAELEGEIGPHAGTSAEVAGVVNFFGPSQLLTMNEQGSTMDHDAPDSPEALLVGGAIQENKDKANQASPLSWVSDDDEPMLLVHGTEDPLVPYRQSVVLEKALEEVGVPAVLLTVTDGGHGKGFGPSVNETVKAWLDHLLLGAGEAVEDGEVAAGE